MGVAVTVTLFLTPALPGNEGSAVQLFCAGLHVCVTRSRQLSQYSLVGDCWQLHNMSNAQVVYLICPPSLTLPPPPFLLFCLPPSCFLSPSLSLPSTVYTCFLPLPCTHTHSHTYPQEKMRGRNKLVPRLLGITRESIMRVDENTKEVLKTWPLTTVRRWAASPNSFTLVRGGRRVIVYSLVGLYQHT